MKSAQYPLMLPGWNKGRGLDRFSAGSGDGGGQLSGHRFRSYKSRRHGHSMGEEQEWGKNSHIRVRR